MDWKDTIRNVAPAIAAGLSAVGGASGSVVGAALSAVSKALLGKPNATEAEVAARVANWTPADELAMKKAEQDFIVSLLSEDNKSAQIMVADRDSARGMHKAVPSNVPAMLSFFALGIFALTIVFGFLRELPAANAAAINQMLGVLTVMVSSSYGFWMGTSYSSSQKTAIIGRIAEK